MADTSAVTNRCSPISLINPSLSEAQTCIKCAEVETQFQQALAELNSAQLIIQLLEKEIASERATSTSSETGEHEPYSTDDWKTKATKSSKRKSEGRKTKRKSNKISSSNEALETKNRYSILTTDDEMHDDQIIMHRDDNLPKLLNNERKENERLDKKECPNIRSPQNESQKKADKQPNLQHQNQTPNQNLGSPLQQHHTSISNEGTTIPTIINGCVIFDSDYQYALQTQTFTNHNLLLLGDSHLRDFAERLSCSLGNYFSVSGIIKPNADIKGIISTSHTVTNNLTKQDMIIFCGGTRDISRNESKSGLHTLEEFAQRTTNTNVILLEAPHRYDLSLSSCVNREVRLFNRRMRSLMSTFNHVTILSTSTKAEHHTRHGLHFNKQGKFWITNNLVKEIRNFYFSHNSTSLMEPRENLSQDCHNNQVGGVSVSQVNDHHADSQELDVSVLQVSDTQMDRQTSDINEASVSDNHVNKLVPDLTVTQVRDNQADSQTLDPKVSQVSDNQVDKQVSDVNVIANVNVIQASDNQVDRQTPAVRITQVSDNLIDHHAPDMGATQTSDNCIDTQAMKLQGKSAQNSHTVAVSVIQRSDSQIDNKADEISVTQVSDYQVGNQTLNANDANGVSQVSDGDQRNIINNERNEKLIASNTQDDELRSINTNDERSEDLINTDLYSQADEEKKQVTISDNKVYSDDQVDPNVQNIRISTRSKRIPNIRSDDFLWT